MRAPARLLLRPHGLPAYTPPNAMEQRKRKTLPRWLSIQPYPRGKLYAELSMETATSVLASLFIFIWQFVFSATPSFQLSLFMQARNLLSPARAGEAGLEDMHCLSIDPQTLLRMKDELGNAAGKIHSEQEIIGKTIALLVDYALERPERRIVAGVDIVIAQSGGQDTLKPLVAALERMPENLQIVFGDAMLVEPRKVSAFSSDFFLRSIINPAAKINPLVRKNCFVGHLNIDSARLYPSLASQPRTIITSIRPVVQSPYSGQDYFSLSFLMYALGELGSSGGLAAEFQDGNTIRLNPDRFNAALAAKAGRSWSGIGESSIIDWQRPAAVIERAPGAFYLKASELLPEIAASPYSLAQQLEDMGAFWEGSSKAGRSGTDYFIIARANLPSFLVQEESDDLIDTPVARVDGFSGEPELVSGTNAHIEFLRNLRIGRSIQVTPPWLEWLLLCAWVLLSLSLALRLSLVKNALAQLAVLLGILLLSFFLFVASGILIQVTMTLTAGVVAFCVITLLRFIRTVTRQEELSGPMAGGGRKARGLPGHLQRARRQLRG